MSLRSYMRATKPLGNVHEKGSAITQTMTMTEIVSYTPAEGEVFRLTKIVGAFPTANLVELLIAGEVKHTYAQAPYSTLIDWFPWGDEYKLVGDGSKKVTIRAQAFTSGGYTCHAEIIGHKE
ncbi:MAG: hypothetical protein ACE5NN_05805 [Candidatus Bathyarchaeia archaeon]